MKLNIELDEKIEPVVSEAGFLHGNYIIVKFGDIEVTMSEQQAEEVYKGIEQSIWDEAHHSENMQKEIETLTARIEALEEMLQNMGAEVAV